MNNAKLTLVGAGPGDPELITLKGIKALKDADVVLYDALIDISLLEYAENAIKILDNNEVLNSFARMNIISGASQR